MPSTFASSSCGGAQPSSAPLHRRLLTIALTSALLASPAAVQFANATATDGLLLASSASSSTVGDALGLGVLREYSEGGSKDFFGVGLDGLIDVPPQPSYNLGFPIITARELYALSNKELRQFIADRRGRCDGCFERRHLLERAFAMRSVPTKNEEIVAMMTPFSTSAPQHLSVDLLRPQSDEELIANHHRAMQGAVLFDPHFTCEVVARSPQYEEGTTEEDVASGKATPRSLAPEIHCKPRETKDSSKE